MPKKNILYLIGSLGIGGAEVLLLNTIKLLGTQHNFTVAYLNGPDDLLSQLNSVDVINLNYKGKPNIFSVAQKLRNIIADKKIDIVHSHLFWPTLIGRLATPKNVRFIFTVHSVLSKDAFSANKLSLLAEKLTYKKKQTAIFVSRTAKEDYEKYVGLKGNYYIVNNFIGDDFCLAENRRGLEFPHQNLRMVSVGNLKEAKNFHFLVTAFEKLKKYKIFLDIYGEGHLRNELQNQINEKEIDNVVLCGSSNKIPAILRKYDVFVMSSKYEGFALAPLEAMAVGLPCLLPDIHSLHEVAGTSASFFHLENETDFINKILDLYHNPGKLKNLSKTGYDNAQKYRKEKFEIALTNIYNG